MTAPRAATWAALVGLSLASTVPPSAKAAVLGDRFVCTVSPGWTGQASMALRMWLTVDKLHVIIPSVDGRPVEGYWTLLSSNEIGVVAASGSAVAAPGFKASANGSMFSILRSNGVIRWTESGADRLPLEDRIGTCSADLPG